MILNIYFDYWCNIWKYRKLLYGIYYELMVKITTTTTTTIKTTATNDNDNNK